MLLPVPLDGSLQLTRGLDEETQFAVPRVSGGLGVEVASLGQSLPVLSEKMLDRRRSGLAHADVEENIQRSAQR